MSYREVAWVKECSRCGHMKQLDEYPLIATPHARRFGGSMDECCECQSDRWRSANGRMNGRKAGLVSARMREVA